LIFAQFASFWPFPKEKDEIRSVGLRLTFKLVTLEVYHLTCGFRSPKVNAQFGNGI
jgi:hypothetical protein